MASPDVRRRLNPRDWNRHRSVIISEYQSRPLEDVRKFMEQNHNFRASKDAFKKQLRKWEVKKRKQDQRKYGAQSSEMSNTSSNVCLQSRGNFPTEPDCETSGDQTVNYSINPQPEQSTSQAFEEEAGESAIIIQQGERHFVSPGEIFQQQGTQAVSQTESRSPCLPRPSSVPISSSTALEQPQSDPTIDEIDPSINLARLGAVSLDDLSFWLLPISTSEVATQTEGFLSHELSSPAAAAEQLKDMATQTDAPLPLESCHQVEAAKPSEDVAIQTDVYVQSSSSQGPEDVIEPPVPYIEIPIVDFNTDAFVDLDHAGRSQNRVKLPSHMDKTLSQEVQAFLPELLSPVSPVFQRRVSHEVADPVTPLVGEDDPGNDTLSAFTDWIKTTMERITSNGRPGFQSRAARCLGQTFDNCEGKKLGTGDLYFLDRVLSAYHLFFGPQSTIFQVTAKKFCRLAVLNNIAKPEHATFFMRTLRTLVEGGAAISKTSEAEKDVDAAVAFWRSSTMSNRDIHEAVRLTATIHCPGEAQTWLNFQADTLLYAVRKFSTLGSFSMAEALLLGVLKAVNTKSALAKIQAVERLQLIVRSMECFAQISELSNHNEVVATLQSFRTEFQMAERSISAWHARLHWFVQSMSCLKTIQAHSSVDTNSELDMKGMLNELSMQLFVEAPNDTPDIHCKCITQSLRDLQTALEVAHFEKLTSTVLYIIRKWNKDFTVSPELD